MKIYVTACGAHFSAMRWQAVVNKPAGVSLDQNTCASRYSQTLTTSSPNTGPTSQRRAAALCFTQTQNGIGMVHRCFCFAAVHSHLNNFIDFSNSKINFTLSIWTPQQTSLLLLSRSSCLFVTPQSHPHICVPYMHFCVCVCIISLLHSDTKDWQF